MLKCLQCGGALASGKLVDYYKTRFKPDGAPFFSLTGTKVEIEALMCQSCGRIELRGDTEKLREILKH